MWRALLTRKQKNWWDTRFEPERQAETVLWLVLLGWTYIFIRTPFTQWNDTAIGRRLMEWGGPEFHIAWMIVTLILAMIPLPINPKKSRRHRCLWFLREIGSASLGMLYIEMGAVFASSYSLNTAITGIAWTFLAPGFYQLMDMVRRAGKKPAI